VAVSNPSARPDEMECHPPVHPEGLGAGIGCDVFAANFGSCILPFLND